MSSYRQHLYHIVFRTKDRQPTIRQNNAHELFSYITGIIKKKNSHLYRINGVENHLHILTDMNPSIAPIDFVKDIKVSSSIWMKRSNLFPVFNGWAVGYGGRVQKTSYRVRYNTRRKVFPITNIIYSAPSELEVIRDHLPLAIARGYSYLALSEPGVIHIWLFHSLGYSYLAISQPVKPKLFSCDEKTIFIYLKLCI